MARLEVGDKFPNAQVLTFAKGERKLSELVSKTGKTAIVFLRYYGCSLSQYDVEQYTKNYADITAGGNGLIVGLQSTTESIKRQCPYDIPFDIISDVDAQLYALLGVEPVDDLKNARGNLTENKIKHLRETTSIVHGDYEGIEEQLPAYFIVDAELNVLFAHYSAELGDVPEPKDFQKLFTR